LVAFSAVGLGAMVAEGVAAGPQAAASKLTSATTTSTTHPKLAIESGKTARKRAQFILYSGKS